MAVKSKIPPSLPTISSGRLGSLLRVPVDYLLEVYVDGRLSTMLALPNTPNAYQQQRPSATHLTHTLGDVIREITPNHLTNITLSGESGYTPRQGHTRDGGVSVLGGRRILEEFDAFLDDYQARASRDPDMMFMVFRALNEGQAFRVEPMSWEWSLDASQNRFSYRWSLHLEAYAGAPSDPRKSIFSPVTEWAKQAQDYVGAGAVAVEFAANALRNARSEFGEVLNAVTSLSRVSRALNNVLDQIDGISTTYKVTAPASLAHLANSYLEVYEDIKELTGEDPDPAQSHETLNYQSLVLAGLFRVNKADLESARSAPLLRLDNIEDLIESDTAPRFSRQVVFRSGDSLSKIASRAYGDASRVSEIIEFNGLRSESQWLDGRPLRVGDVLSVPYDDALADDRGLALRGDIYGRDLRLEDGDLVIGDDDLRVIEGLPNLKQALKTRLLSEQGSATYNPEYGLPVSIGAPLTAKTVAFFASHVSQQIRLDARVDDVTNVSIETEGDTMSARVDVIPLDSAPLAVVVPLNAGVE